MKSVRYTSGNQATPSDRGRAGNPQTASAEQPRRSVSTDIMCYGLQHGAAAQLRTLKGQAGVSWHSLSVEILPS